ncbi:hypothetical protein M3J09_011752 [Ascochyta lentis]
MSHLTLLRLQPRGRQRRVGEQKEAKHGHKRCHCALTASVSMGHGNVHARKTYRMKSHLHPAISRKPSMPANTPAAISPENPVAKICAQYRSAMRVATSATSSAPTLSCQNTKPTHLCACKKYSACTSHLDKMAPR